MKINSEEIKEMFNEISSGYDNMNRIISLNMDQLIKRASVSLLNLSAEDKVLDLCSGTGDITGFICKYTKNVTGIDFSEKMLEIAEKRYPQIKFVNADVTDLPFEDDCFDAVTIAYGLRNIPDKTKAIQEIHRVLKDGGKVLHLDFGNKNFFGKVFEFYVPVLAKFFGKNVQAYKYLVDSKRGFYTPEELENLFGKNGFALETKEYYLLKSIACEIFVKI